MRSQRIERLMLLLCTTCLQKDLELVGDVTDADDVEDWEDGGDEFQSEPIKRDDVRQHFIYTIQFCRLNNSVFIAKYFTVYIFSPIS